MKQPRQRILYQNYELDYEEAKECCIDGHWEEYEEEYEPTEDEIHERALRLKDIEYEEFEWDFKNFMDNNTFILQGYCGTWRGRAKGGFVFDSFGELARVWEDMGYVKIYDENGHLFVKFSHHDGTDLYEVRMLNDKGYEYYSNHHYYDDEERLHDKLMKNPYSVLPNYAHKVWGCPKRDYVDKN